MRLNESRVKNRQEVFEEDKREHTPQMSEAQRMKQEWREAQEKKKKELVEKGEDPDKEYLNDTVLKADGQRKKDKQKEKNKTLEFRSSLWINTEASVRAYKKRCRNLPTHRDANTPVSSKELYQEMRRVMPKEDLYRTANSLQTGIVPFTPPPEFLDRMVDQLKKDEESRGKFSRRRPIRDEDAVDYIHGGNRNFNKKLAKAFDRYTADIKANLERGTAL